VETVLAVHWPGRRALVGVAGPPASGKSRLARFLVTATEPAVAAVVAQDGFHLPNDVLAETGRRDRKGAPDTFDAVAFIGLLDRLRHDPDRLVLAPVFRREIEEVVEDAVPIGPDVDMVVVEGNYLLLDADPWSGIAERLDLALYLDTPADVRRRRLLARQLQTYGSQEAAVQWVERVDEPNARIVEATQHRADAVVEQLDLPPEGGG
jgi:pantothenate kinase